MFLEELIRSLDSEKVPYALIGGLAVNLYGVPRMTYDVDLVISLDDQSLTRAHNCLVRLGLRCRQPISIISLASENVRRQLEEEKNLKAVTYSDPAAPLREVDILVNSPLDVSDLLSRSVVMNYRGNLLRVISKTDLIALKNASGREQDADDVKHLLRTP